MRLASPENQEPVTFRRSDGVTVYHLMIANPTEPRVLMFRDGDSWTLPFFEPQEHHFGVVGHINRAVKESLDLDTTVLRCVSYRFTDATNRLDAIYLLENHDPTWVIPAYASWIGIEAARRISFETGEQRAAVLDWLAEAAGGSTPAERRPWARPGWFGQASNWISRKLGNQEALTPVCTEQVRVWERSCILKATASGGIYYFKAAPTRLAQEIQVTQALSAMFPQNSVELVAVEPDRHWMLMKKLSGRLLSTISDCESWRNALREFAQVQIHCSSALDDTVFSTIPDYRLGRLDTYLDELLADESALLLDTPAGLTTEQLLQLQSLAPTIRSAFLELADYGIPHTLTHGDFWAGNVVEQNGKYVFFDWSDATISHPFFDLTFFLGVDKGLLPRDSHEALRDAYLSPWFDVKPESQVHAAYEIARRLSWVHKALIEHRLILRGMEDAAKWEFENALPYYVKKAISAWA